MYLMVSYMLRSHCTNVDQLWTRVKSEFESSSAVNCVALKQFKRWISVQFWTAIWPPIKFWSWFKWWMSG